MNNNINIAILACPDCNSKFQVNPHELTETGRNVRCSNCGNIWFTNQNESLMPNEKKQNHKTEKQSYTNLIINARKQQATSFFKNKRLFIPEMDSNKNHRSKNITKILRFIAWPLALSSAAITFISATPSHNHLPLIKNQMNEILYSSQYDKNQSFSIENIKYTKQNEDGKQLLIISGLVKNISNKPNIPPSVNIRFLQNNRETAQVFNLSMRKKKLQPNESQKFVSRLPPPSADIKTISIELQK